MFITDCEICSKEMNAMNKTQHRKYSLQNCGQLTLSPFPELLRQLVISTLVLWIGDLHNSLTQDGFVKVFGAT